MAAHPPRPAPEPHTAHNVTTANATPGDHRTAIADAEGCRAWLASLPLADAGACHGELAAQVTRLSDASLPAAARLEMLELVREAVGRAQDAQAARLRGRPVPLDDDERATWDNVVALWRAMAAGYDSLIDAMADTAPELAADAALICQRALRYTTLAMAEHHHVYRNVPGALWKQLHRLYVFAENAGAATTAVNDAAGRTVAGTSCVATYAHALLMQLAQPDALGAQQMAAVDRWLERWTTIVSLSPIPLAAGAIPALAVDLASEKGAMLAHSLPSAGVRHLDLEQLSRAVRQAAAAFRQGQIPPALACGLAPEACEKLLMLLHVQWCAAGTGRMDERSPGGIIVTISPSLPAIHYQITGRPFRQGGAELTARERQSMDMMGLISEASDRVLVSQRSAAIETWVIINKSASGFLGMCRDPNTATHVGYNQLLGLRNPTNKAMYLGTVQRLIVDDAGAIWVGLRLLSGAAQAAAARQPDAPGAAAAQFERALVLPADAGRKIPATVLLMPGWYAANRNIELHGEKVQRVRLRALYDQGPNFDRATFAAA